MSSIDAGIAQLEALYQKGIEMSVKMEKQTMDDKKVNTKIGQANV